MSFNIEIEGGASLRLPTGGKYCDQDIIITSTGADLSATTATANDVSNQKVFFAADGTQTTGGLADFSDAPCEGYYATFDNNNKRCIINPPDDVIIRTGQGIYLPYSLLAMQLGLIESVSQTTSNKLAEGFTLFGVTGTLSAPRRTVKITNNGQTSYAYITYDGVKYYTSNDTFTVPDGATITCYANAGAQNIIYVNGSPMKTASPLTYEYTVTSDIDVSFTVSLGSHAYINITTK